MSAIGGFEREVDIEERRKKRQEEWDKVRTSDQPEGNLTVSAPNCALTRHLGFKLTILLELICEFRILFLPNLPTY